MKYAREHGYDFAMYQRRWSQRPPSWDKILFAQQQLRYCDWLFWIDADAIATRPIDDLVEHHKFLVVGSNRRDRLNFGMFLLRNCRLSYQFLKDVWGQVQFIDHFVWEQRAVAHITDIYREKKRKKNPYYKAMKLLPYGELWCHPGDLVGGARAVHAANCESIENRRKLLGELFD